MKDYRRLFVLIVAALLVLYAGVGALSLSYASFFGNLTRMGMLPEKDFAWRKPQPTVPADFMVNSKLSDADVLVIGDSFSDPWLWQSVLVQQGMKVHSLQWGQVRGVCGDIASWLKSRGFKGTRVVIESAEWKLGTVLSASLSCSNTPSNIPDVEGRRPSPATTIDTSTPDVSGKMSVGLRTMVNGWRYTMQRKQSGFARQAFTPVTVHRIANGCALFSHLYCEDTPFLDYEAEAENEPQAQRDVPLMKQIESRLPGYQITWVLVPNKTTIYLQPDKRFWREAGQSLHVPDTQAGLRELVAQRKVIDLYMPNDTHLSTAGYLELGRIVYRDLMKSGTTGSGGKNPPAPAASKS